MVAKLNSKTYKVFGFLEPLRLRLSLQLAKSATKGKKKAFVENIQYGYQKIQNFMLIFKSVEKVS
jgi:hypothetical protein